MTNHVHLLLTPHAADARALLMKYLSQCYVQRVNRRTGRSATLWEGRFRSCLVASEHYVLTCYRYIELNPVLAGMVSHPAYDELLDTPLDVKLVEEIRKATRGGLRRGYPAPRSRSASQENGVCPHF